MSHCRIVLGSTNPRQRPPNGVLGVETDNPPIFLHYTGQPPACQEEASAVTGQSGRADGYIDPYKESVSPSAAITASALRRAFFK